MRWLTSAYMPAEWEPHESTWLTWPTNKTTWPGRLLKEVESIYIQMIAGLLTGEKVNLLVPNKKTAHTILKRLNASHVGATRRVAPTNLFFHEVKTVDTWIRDYGPIFIKRRQLAGERRTGISFTKWNFNAWGGKYSDLARDNRVVDRIAALKDTRRFDTGIVLEGGSIDVNGRGTCITTEQCLLSPSRNSHLSKNGIEGFLRRFLGIRKVVWLKEGIEGDDTDGHVDDITRFVNPTTVLTATESDTRDKNHTLLKENLEILKLERDQDGKRFHIRELPMPGRVGAGRSDSDGDRLPASYANFYIGNKVVLVPVYSHKNDKSALKIIREAFPGRKTIGIECTALVYGLGSIHCVTQQEPK